jgi:hypothetical protein
MMKSPTATRPAADSMRTVEATNGSAESSKRCASSSSSFDEKHPELAEPRRVFAAVLQVRGLVRGHEVHRGPARAEDDDVTSDARSPFRSAP